MTILESCRRACAASATLVLIVATAACSSSSPTSPTPAAGAGGALIEGRVSAPPGTGYDNGPSSTAAATTAGLLVRIEGTSISTSVTSTGTFRLAQVPPGRVRLQFSGAAVNATADLGQVATNEVVQLQVQVNASTAVVVSQTRSATLELCHAEGNGSYHKISVSPEAEPAHRAHGDGKVGDPIPGRTGQTFGPQCEPVGLTQTPPPETTEKVTLCHKAGSKWIEITVGRDAEADHRAHGDGKIGEAVPGQAGKTFGAGCVVQ